MQVYLWSPPARDRQDPTDFKGWKLDFDCKPMTAEANDLAPGVLSYWNLASTEQIFAVFQNVKQADGSVVNKRVPIENDEVVKKLYDDFKGIIVQACTANMFRGGAFAEKVKIDSPLDDILQFIYWSPVMTKEHRWYFAKTIFPLIAKVVSSLKAHEVLSTDAIAEYQLVVRGIENFFDSDKTDPAPIPTDVSQAWQEEFGNEWVEKYVLALGGGPKASFQTVAPPQFFRDKDGLTIKGWDVSMKRLYAGHSTVRGKTHEQMLDDVLAGSSSDYAEAMRSMITKKGNDQEVTAGLSDPLSGGARGKKGVEYGEEYNDRFRGSIIDADLQGTHLKDMLDKAVIDKQLDDEKKAAEESEKKSIVEGLVEVQNSIAWADRNKVEEAEEHEENKKGESSTRSFSTSKKSKGKGKGKGKDKK